MANTFSAPVVGGGSVLLVSGALIALALGRASLAAIRLSALLFGAGFMVGSAVLAIWTAHVVLERPGDASTVTLVVGAVPSIAAPAVMGTLIPVLGLPAMLVVVGVLSSTAAAVLTVVSRARANVTELRRSLLSRTRWPWTPAVRNRLSG